MDIKLKGLLSVAVLATAFSLGNSSAKAGDLLGLDPHVNQVLGITPSCGHMIDLLMRNQMRKLHGDFIDISAFPQSAFGPIPLDMELLNVHMVCDGTDVCGPKYQISFRNNSRLPIYNFHVTIVGVLGRIIPTCPMANIHVACLKPGEIGTVQLQLPHACMTMGIPGQAAVGFDTLVVAVDAFDMVGECNELNNVAILKRAGIETVVTETTTAVQGAAPVAPAQGAPAQAVPGQAAPVQGAPAQGGQVVPANPAPAPGNAAVAPNGGQDRANPSPLDNINLDELGLGDDDKNNAEDEEEADI